MTNLIADLKVSIYEQLYTSTLSIIVEPSLIAISPLVSGNAVKGPLGEMRDSLEGSRSPEVFIRHYEALIDGFVVDISDESQVRNIDLPCRALPTLMTDADSRLALAKQAFSFASSLRDH